jgi:DNA polymerase III subunit delta'
MPIVPIHGHDALRKGLVEAIRRGTLPQSLLFHGPAGVGKQRLALWLAQALLCQGEQVPCGACAQCRFSAELTHPDLIWIFPRPRLRDADLRAEEVKLDVAQGVAERVLAGGLYAPPPGSEALYVATIQMLVHESASTPAMGRKKVYIVGDADRMVLQDGADHAANAFLKLLEEPPADTVLILTSSSQGALLPTIRSRVVSMRVPPLPDPAVRGWLSEPLVKSALATIDLPRGVDDRIRLAAGAPGRLLSSSSTSAADAAARTMLEAALSGDRARAIRVAMSQKVSGARGTFSDVLDALTSALHEKARDAVLASDERLARNAARAVDLVEESKLLAAGNVNPQLITADLIRHLSRALSA